MEIRYSKIASCMFKSWNSPKKYSWKDLSDKNIDSVYAIWIKIFNHDLLLPSQPNKFPFDIGAPTDLGLETTYWGFLISSLGFSTFDSILAFFICSNTSS